MKTKSLKIYLCGTDMQDIALGATDIIAYPTLKSLKKNRSCLDECGYVVCELKMKKVLKKSNFFKKKN
jgi:hypothetical protein